MNLRFTFLIFSLSIFTAQAQVSSISTGSGYSKQSFFNFATGEEFQLNNDAWDIAFSNLSQTDVGVFINESVSSTGTPLQLFLAPTNDWSTNLNDLSIYTDSLVIYNKELNWTEGAFNSVANASNPFDFGWGDYNLQNHTIVGTKVFVIKMRDGNFKKLQIVNFAAGAYNIKYANMDGSNEQTASISKSNKDYGKTIFFSLKSNKVIDTPKEYDIIFMRYYTPLDEGEGNTVEYVVTGVLTAPGVEAVSVTGIDSETVNEADYADQYSSLPTIIGHDWKRFDFSQGWILSTDQVFFVKTAAKDVYKLVFIDFEGSQTGTAILDATYLGNTTSVNEISGLENTVSIFPNPTSEYITVGSETSKEIKVEFFNFAGQLLQTSFEKTNVKINLPRIFGDNILSVRVLVDNKIIVKNIIVK